METDKPVHRIVMDGRPGRDRAQDREVLWEYDTDDLRSPEEGQVLTSPTGEQFEIIGADIKLWEGRETQTIYVADLIA